MKQGELKAFNPITEEYVFEPIMDVAVREKLPVIGYYASFTLINGFEKELFWTVEKMKEHALRYSQGYKNDVQKGTAYTFWSKDFHAMAEKTMIRQLISKWGIMSIDMQRAYESDMGVINESGNVRYVDNEPEDPAVTSQEEIEEKANKEELVVDSEITEEFQ